MYVALTRRRYSVQKSLGKGKFSIVKSGYSHATKEKVAIKIIDKTDLSEADMEMQRNEIEILKIA